MKSPNPEHLKELLKAARGYDWRNGEKRLRLALERAARSERPRRDGFPATTMGGSGRHAAGNGHGDPTASVAVQRPMLDPLAVHTTKAIVALKDVVDATDRFDVALATIDRLSTVDDIPGCSVLARYGQWEPVHATTEEYGALGRWAYDYSRRQKRLPSREEVELHLEGGRVR